MTLPEIVLWRELRRRAVEGLRFRKQHPMGDYVLDFYLPSARLAIEVDGIAHDMGDNPARDERRDAWLAARGIGTLRIAARDVLSRDGLEGALRAIVAAVESPPPSASPPPPPLHGGGIAKSSPAKRGRGTAEGGGGGA